MASLGDLLSSDEDESDDEEQEQEQEQEQKPSTVLNDGDGHVSSTTHEDDNDKLRTEKVLTMPCVRMQMEDPWFYLYLAFLLIHIFDRNLPQNPRMLATKNYLRCCNRTVVISLCVAQL